MSEKHIIVDFSTLAFRKTPKMSESKNNIFKEKILFLRKPYYVDLMTVPALETLTVLALGQSCLMFMFI